MRSTLSPTARGIHRRWLADPLDAFLPIRPPFDRPADDPAGVPLLIEDTDHCPRCGRSTALESLSARGCPTCYGRPLPWQRLVRLGTYADPLDAHLRALKFGQHWRLACPLGHALADRIGVVPRSAADRTVATWVPLHWSRRWRRGYDQSRLIAEAMADRLGVAALPLLRRVRRTPPQSLLNEADRRRNVTATAFAPRPIDLTDHRVILVDDVLTTGSTAAACCRLLARMHAAEVTLAVVAVTQRRHAPLD
jgi:ComF family protein